MSTNKSGAELIAAERQRQIEVEGWDATNDDQHENDELLHAAAVYMSATCTYGSPLEDVVWPWDAELFKPGEPVDKIRCLTKAGAILAAEIDRLQRIVELPPMPGFNGDERAFR